MSIEKITEKIVTDAEEEAKAVREEADARCAALLAEARQKADAILTEREKQGQEEKEKRVQRMHAVADIDGKKLRLETKQQLISACFDQAAAKLSSMETQQYAAFLAALAASTGETTGELVLSASDRKTVGEALMAALSTQFPACQFTLSSETRAMDGGLFLKQGAVYLNETFEALLEDAKEQLTAEVAQKLFV